MMNKIEAIETLFIKWAKTKWARTNCSYLLLYIESGDQISYFCVHFQLKSYQKKNHIECVSHIAVAAFGLVTGSDRTNVQN